MAEVRLTKNELRLQQTRLAQLEKYLPTLQLKKALLQAEVNEVRLEIQRLEAQLLEVRLLVSQSGSLFSEHLGLDFSQAAKITVIEKKYENIAGVDIPQFTGIQFVPFEYPLFTTPAWLDVAVQQLRRLATARARILVAQEKKGALEKELQEVSIRVNLFEKNLIPRSKEVIKKIQVFLGDQELAAVGQAKVAKAKIEKKKKKKLTPCV